VFTKNSNQWRARPVTPEDIANYKTAQKESRISPVVAHSSYLINLAALDRDTLKRSREALIDELVRCELLGIPYLNFHPGAHGGVGIDDGLRRIVESLDWVHERTKGCKVLSVLETTAGQGTSLGWRFEHLRTIIDGVQNPERMAACIDTCHIFAAGYDLRDAESYRETMRQFGEIVGFERLVAIHVNDSKKGLGSHVDRHEHIGKGEIGKKGFRELMNDPRLERVPKLLETPKGEDLREDIANLKVLRSLVRGGGPSTR
jgi:deoxyribonuclease-4